MSKYVLPVKGTLFSLMIWVALAIASREAYAGEFSFGEEYCDSSTEEKYCAIDYHYSGKIESKDVEKFKTMLKNTERRSNSDREVYLQIFLNSKGGDIDAALKIGKLIRVHQMQTLVFDECNSSCVIVFASGVRRYANIELWGPIPNGAKVGIHRPYTTAEGSYEKHRHKFREVERQIKQFLREGGVSERLWDDMVKISPENIKFLSQKEAIDYGLNGEDPAYADFVDGKKAKQYGITRAKYLKRKAMIKEKCESNTQVLADTTGKELQQCKQNILHGRAP